MLAPFPTLLLGILPIDRCNRMPERHRAEDYRKESRLRPHAERQPRFTERGCRTVLDGTGSHHTLRVLPNVRFARTAAIDVRDANRSRGMTCSEKTDDL